MTSPIRPIRSIRHVRLTAAICTRDRVRELQRALSSLVAQEEPPDEILVVENAPRDERTREMVERHFPGTRPRVRYVAEPVPGLDFARNRALAEATGEVIAFLDDDAVADPGWAGALRRPFVDPGVGAVTGRVEALSTDTPGQRLVEANGGYSRGRRRIRLPEDAHLPLHGRPAPRIAWAVSVGSGCSLAVRTELLRKIGGFDEALDLGSELPGGGDHDALWRVLEAGSSVVYEPLALARHEHRRDLAAARSQIVGHQRALVAFLVKSLHRARGRKRFGILFFLLWRLGKPIVRLVRRANGKDPLPAPVLLRMLADCWAGLWAYPVARRTAARRRSRFPPLPPTGPWSPSPDPS
jgi:GT2 family glycosyltransferase